MEDKKKNQISDEELALIGTKLNEKIKNFNCVMCGEKNWTLEPFIAPITLSNDFSIKLGGQMLPLVSITCTNCGNTHFFNLVTLGIADKITEKKGGSK